MKKLLSGLLALSVLLAGCTSSPGPAPAPKEDVTVNIPASFFEMTQTDAKTAFQDNETEGVKSLTVNDDGSVTIVYDGETYSTMMADYKKDVEKQFDEMVTDTETFPNIVGIKYNDDFTTFDVTLESGEVTFVDAIAIMMFYMQGSLYQMLLGNDYENTEIIVNFVDKNGNVIETASSKDQ